MNKYEIMFIVKPDVEEDARNQLIENFKNILSNGEGSVDNVNEWDYVILLMKSKITLKDIMSL